MNAIRKNLWDRFFTSDAAFRWPPFLIDLALDLGIDCDPEELLQNEEFLKTAQAAIEGRGVKRMPRDFDWSTIREFCAAASGNGFQHFIAVETVEQLDRLTDGVNIDRSGSLFNETNMEDYRQVVAGALVAFIPQYNPNAGANGGNSGFEAFLHTYALNRAVKVLQKLVHARKMMSLDDAFRSDGSDGHGSRDDIGVRKVLERAAPEQMTTRPAQAATGEIQTHEIFDIIARAEKNALKDSPAAALYVLSMTGAKNVTQAAAFLGIPMQTAYRWLNETCRNIVQEVQRLIALDAGMDVDTARHEVLGYFLGYRKRAYSLSPAGNFEAMLGLLDG